MEDFELMMMAASLLPFRKTKAENLLAEKRKRQASQLRRHYARIRREVGAASRYLNSIGLDLTEAAPACRE